MARSRVEDHEVIRAGIALREAGEPVNGWALRRRLGGGKSDRLLAVWKASPEGRQEAARAPRGRVPPKTLAAALSAITHAASAALEEVDRIVSQHGLERDADHARELADATKWAESLEERLDLRLREMQEQAEASTARAVLAEAQAAAVPGLRQELADVRTLLQAAQAAEATLRAEAERASASRDEALARVAQAEQREREALERAARTEGALAALQGAVAARRTTHTQA